MPAHLKKFFPTAVDLSAAPIDTLAGHILTELNPGRLTTQAVRAADRAIAAATKGGHEDVRQLVRLTGVRLAMEDLLSDERDSIARRLDEIERYALVMGMPRLLADITYAKASHLLKLGETRHATSLACKCIQVASPKSMWTMFMQTPSAQSCSRRWPKIWRQCIARTAGAPKILQDLDSREDRRLRDAAKAAAKATIREFQAFAQP